MEAHIFPAKDNFTAKTGGRHFLAFYGKSAKHHTHLTMPNINNTYPGLSKMSTAYNENSWYWTVSRINDLVAKYLIYLKMALSVVIERLETQWMEEQAAYDKDKLAWLTSQKKLV